MTNDPYKFLTSERYPGVRQVCDDDQTLVCSTWARHVVVGTVDNNSVVGSVDLDRTGVQRLVNQLQEWLNATN